MALATAYAKVLAREFVWKCEESFELEDNLFHRRVQRSFTSRQQVDPVDAIVTFSTSWYFESSFQWFPYDIVCPVTSCPELIAIVICDGIQVMKSYFTYFSAGTCYNTLGPNILLNTLYSVTCSLCSSLNLYEPCVLYIGQAFRCSSENAFYIFNRQIYFIILYLLDRVSLK